MIFDARAWRPLGAIIALSIAPVLWFVLAADPVDEPTAYATLAMVACAVATISAWALFPRFFSLDAISLPSLFAISTFALIVFPLPVVVGLLPEWHWQTWFGAVAAAYVLTLLGIASYALASRSESDATVRMRYRALEGEAFVAICLLAISLLATAYWMITVRDFALFTALRGGATAGDLLELREGAHKLLEGPIARVVTYLRGLV